MPTLLELFDVNEAVRGGVLYHGTDPDNAVQIMAADRINGSTPHNAKPLRVVNGVNKLVPLGFRQHEIERFDNVYGVSLTRDPNFARRWKSGQGVVLVLDEQKLRQKFRMMPVNYYGDRTESEEFVVGAIQPLSRYLVAIEVAEGVMQEMVEEDEVYAPGDGRYELITNHPLLRVNGVRWHPMTGKIQKVA